MSLIAAVLDKQLRISHREALDWPSVEPRVFLDRVKLEIARLARYEGRQHIDSLASVGVSDFSGL